MRITKYQNSGKLKHYLSYWDPDASYAEKLADEQARNGDIEGAMDTAKTALNADLTGLSIAGSLAAIPTIGIKGLVNGALWGTAGNYVGSTIGENLDTKFGTTFMEPILGFTGGMLSGPVKIGTQNHLGNAVKYYGRNLIEGVGDRIKYRDYTRKFLTEKDGQLIRSYSPINRVGYRALKWNPVVEGVQYDVPVAIVAEGLPTHNVDVAVSLIDKHGLAPLTKTLSKKGFLQHGDYIGADTTYPTLGRLWRSDWLDALKMKFGSQDKGYAPGSYKLMYKVAEKHPDMFAIRHAMKPVKGFRPNTQDPSVSYMSHYQNAYDSGALDTYTFRDLIDKFTSKFTKMGPWIDWSGNIQIPHPVLMYR